METDMTRHALAYVAGAYMNIPCAMRRTSPWRNCMESARRRWTTPA